jgi:titin
VPNLGNGVAISGGASGNMIGGASAAPVNVISGNTNDGVLITGAGTDANLVQGNYIGTNKAGAAAIPNRNNGVEIANTAVGNTIGGTTPAPSNLISGNGNDGVLIAGANTTKNVVAGDFIGTDATGTAAVPNQNDGVLVDNAASGNTIGGTTAAARNVLSGNENSGIELIGAGVQNNLLEGNFVGSNAAGTASVANGFGVQIQGAATKNTIGGTAAGAGNVLSGNLYFGLQIFGAGTDDNLAEGNFVGTDLTGTKAVPNQYAGVAVGDGPMNNTIGGTAAGARNVVSGNTGVGGDGVVISDASNNLVQGNYIGTDVTGATALGNGVNGVLIVSDAQGTANGNIVDSGNMISGNGTDGVMLTGANTTYNTVQGNDIGTVAVPNKGNGVEVAGAGAGNAIVGNAIAGNTLNGVFLNGTGAGVSGNTIAGNGGDGVQVNGVTNATIGPNNTITGNAGNGIQVLNGSTGIVIVGNTIGGAGVPGNGLNGVFLNNVGGNTVGGTTAGAGMPSNVISGNGTANVAGMQNGVLIAGALATGNTVEGDYIGTDATGKTAVPTSATASRSSARGATRSARRPRPASPRMSSRGTATTAS